MLLVWPRWVGEAGSRTHYLGPWGHLQHAYVSPAPSSNHQWVSTVHLDNYTRVCRRLFSGQVSPAESGSSDGEWFFPEPSTLMVGCSRVCSLHVEVIVFFVQRHNLCQFSIVWKFTGVNTLVKNVAGFTSFGGIRSWPVAFFQCPVIVDWIIEYMTCGDRYSLDVLDV